LAFVPEILDTLGISRQWDLILFGLGAITFAKHPEGILEFQKRKSLMFVQRLISRGQPPVDGEKGGRPVAPQPAPAAAVAARGGDR
jgi:hypothetical protein